MIIGPASAAIILAREADLKRVERPVLTRTESSQGYDKKQRPGVAAAAAGIVEGHSPQIIVYGAESLEHIAAQVPSHLLVHGREARSVYAGTANQRKNAAHQALEGSNQVLKLVRGTEGFDDYLGVLDLKKANQVQRVQILDNERVITYNQKGRVIEDRELRSKEARGLSGMDESGSSNQVRGGFPPGPLGMAMQAVILSAMGATTVDADPSFDLSDSLRQLNDFEAGLKSYVSNFDNSGNYTLNEFAGLGIDTHEQLSSLLDIVERERPTLKDVVSKARGIDYHRQAVEELTAYYNGITEGVDGTTLSRHLREYVENEKKALEHYKSKRFVDHLTETISALRERVPELRSERESVQESIESSKKTIADYESKISRIRGRKTSSGLYSSDLAGIPDRDAVNGLMTEVDKASAEFDGREGQAHRDKAIAIIQDALGTARDNLTELERKVTTCNAAEAVIDGQLGSISSLRGSGYREVQAERRKARGTEVNLGIAYGFGDESEIVNPVGQPIVVTHKGSRSDFNLHASIGPRKEDPRLFASIRSFSVDDGTINTPNPGTYTREGHEYLVGLGHIFDLSGDKTLYIGAGYGSSKDVRTYTFPSDPGNNEVNSRDGEVLFGIMNFRGQGYELRLRGGSDSDNDRPDDTVFGDVEIAGLWGEHGEIALLYSLRDVDNSVRVPGEDYIEHSFGLRVQSPEFALGKGNDQLSLIGEMQASDIGSRWSIGADWRPHKDRNLVVAYRVSGAELERENPLEVRTDETTIHTFSLVSKF